MNPIVQIKNIGIDENNALNYILSINLRIDGLSFIITEGEQIAKAECYEWQAKDWASTYNHFTQIHNQSSLLMLQFSKTLIFVQSKESSLVPSEFFDKDKVDFLLETYLGTKQFVGHYQKLKYTDAFLVFGVDRNLKKSIVNLFPKAELYHHSAFLIDQLLQSGKTNALAIHIGTQSFEIAAICNGQLVGHNNFEFQNIDEFMFFLLSFVTQNGLDPKTSELIIGGKLMMDSKIGMKLSAFFPQINSSRSKSSDPKLTAFDNLIKSTLLANS